MLKAHAAKSRELKEGERRIIKIDGHVGLLRINGIIVAFSNICPRRAKADT